MKIFLALLLLSPFVRSEDIFPIELTCELGSDIVYININSNIDDDDLNWITIKKYYSYLRFNSIGKSKFFDKKLPLSRLTLSNETIGIKFFQGIDSYFVNINRLNAKGYISPASHSRYSGECFKGFKEYNDKQI